MYWLAKQLAEAARLRLLLQPRMRQISVEKKMESLITREEEEQHWLHPKRPTVVRDAIPGSTASRLSYRRTLAPKFVRQVRRVSHT